MINDTLLIKIAREVSNGWPRRNYEEFLIELGYYSMSTLRDDEEFFKLTKYDLILDTLRDHGKNDPEFLIEINERRSLSKEILQPN